MKLSKLKYLSIGIGMAVGISLSASSVESVVFEGDYGAGNRNSALGGASHLHLTEVGDFNGDGATDSRRYIPISFPYPGLDHGPYGIDFQIDSNLFGVNGLFYTGGQFIAYDPAPGFIPDTGLWRWGGTPQMLQVTSGPRGTNPPPTGDIGMLVVWFVVKEDFLNGSDVTDDLKLPNEDGAFSADLFFRAEPNLAADPDAFRRGRFVIRAGDKWYVSGTGTENDPAVMEQIKRDQPRSLAINPAADYWYEWDETTVRFIEEDGNGVPVGTGVRGDSLSDITAAGIVMQNTRLDAARESNYGWLSLDEMIFYLDPEPEPIVDVPAESWLDTGEWLGLIYNTHAPWVYSPRLSGWIFLPEQETDEGGWVFIPAVRAATAE
jgi:hypothetical protein